MFYDGSVISKETNVISIADSEETLMLEEENRSKMLLKQSDPKVLEKKVNIKPINYAELNQLSEDLGKRFVPQQELSDEQAFRLQPSNPNTDQSASSPVKIEAPWELPKEKVLVINILKNNRRKFKRKDIVDNAAQVLNDTTIALRMYKLDRVTLAPKDKNNRETHIYYLKHTMEQAVILREIVEQANLLNLLDSASYSACKYVKLIQDLLGYVRDTCPDIHKPSEKLKEEWKPTGKVFTKYGYNWRPTGRTFTLVRNACPLSRNTATNKMPLREHIPLEVVAQESIVTKDYTRRPKVVQILLWYLDCGCSKNMTRDFSQLTNFIHKFLGTVKFRNDQIAKIMRYGDYQIGNILISRVYYAKGLRHCGNRRGRAEYVSI
nr:integrase, catalytic region, zinc finger, CCHC-type, peptidase aspartic, catalytic [Tanacetum cinerariifolium]